VASVRAQYTVQVERSGSWWAIMVPELRGVYSQSRTLAGVEPMVREAISLFLDVPEDSFDVAAVKVLDPATEDAIRAAAEARKAAAERQREATARTREAVVALRRRGLPQRDIGRMVGISHQRVAQLLASATKG